MVHDSRNLIELVEVIRTSPLAKLTDQDWLEHELLPQLGLTQNIARFSPPFLHEYCGKGLRSFQHPNQFAQYLVCLSARQIKSYIEVGTFEGGTFVITVEYLHRFCPIEVACAVDPYILPQMREYAELNSAVHLLVGTLDEKDIISEVSRRVWDLALIDADHTEEGVTKDFRSLFGKARLLAFHDIDNDNWPGVRSLWQKVKSQVGQDKVQEFVEQYEWNLSAGRGRLFGLGVADLS
jgi:hypothetical protein